MARFAETLQIAIGPRFAALLRRLDMVNLIPELAARPASPIVPPENSPAHAPPAPGAYAVALVMSAHPATYNRGAVRFGLLP